MKKLLIIFVLLSLESFSQHCGTWRWDVKTLTDPEGIQILSKPVVTTTISALAAETAPQSLSTGHNFNGRLDGEHNLIRVDALIIKCKKEPDHDYHLVLQDPNSNATIVSEIPDPECDNLRNFPDLQERYRKLRAWISSKTNITSSMKEVDPAIAITVEGVAFWDAPHGATGASDEGREIHPITDITSAAGSIMASTVNTTPFLPNNPPDLPNGNPTESSITMNTTTTAQEMLYLILLGGILGMAGQVIRFLAGLKKPENSPNATPGSTRSIASGIDSKQMLLGLLIALIVGSIAGVLASLSMAGKPIDRSVIIAFLAAGYAGTDLIEGFVIKK